jgi:hypothetical protein
LKQFKRSGPGRRRLAIGRLIATVARIKLPRKAAGGTWVFQAIPSDDRGPTGKIGLDSPDKPGLMFDSFDFESFQK